MCRLEDWDEKESRIDWCYHKELPICQIISTTELHLSQLICLPATTSSSINQERGSNGATACTSEMVLLIDGKNNVGMPAILQRLNGI
jgi:hypothetical protein